MIVSVFGAVLPPFLIISAVSVFYEIFRDNRIVAAMLSGMQTGVGAVIISVVYEMAKGQSKKENRIELAIIMVVAFMASYVFDISVIYIILACIGLESYNMVFQERRREVENDLSAIIFKFFKDWSI